MNLVLIAALASVVTAAATHLVAGRVRARWQRCYALAEANARGVADAYRWGVVLRVRDQSGTFMLADDAMLQYCARAVGARPCLPGCLPGCTEHPWFTVLETLDGLVIETKPTRITAPERPLA